MMSATRQPKHVKGAKHPGREAFKAFWKQLQAKEAMNVLPLGANPDTMSDADVDTRWAHVDPKFRAWIAKLAKVDMAGRRWSQLERVERAKIRMKLAKLKIMICRADDAVSAF